MPSHHVHVILGNLRTPLAKSTRKPILGAYLSAAASWGNDQLTEAIFAARIAENFDVVDVELTTEQLAAIDALDTGVRGGTGTRQHHPGDVRPDIPTPGGEGSRLLHCRCHRVVLRLELCVSAHHSA
jgi:hypothetical protein